MDETWLKYWSTKLMWHNKQQKSDSFFFFPYIIGNYLACRAVAMVFTGCTSCEIVLKYSCATAALSFDQKMEVMMLDLGLKIKVKSFRFRNILDFSVFFFSSHLMHLYFTILLYPLLKYFKSGVIKMLHYSHWYWCVFWIWFKKKKKNLRNWIKEKCLWFKTQLYEDKPSHTPPAINLKNMISRFRKSKQKNYEISK